MSRSSLLLCAAALFSAVGTLSAQSDINVPAGTNVTLNESASYQNVTVGSGGSLETIDANSGGGGDHAITSPAPPAARAPSRTTA